MMARLIGEGVDVFRVKRRYRDYQIVDEGGDVLAHITYDSLVVAGGGENSRGKGVELLFGY
jgi:hypothetical protein